MTCKSYFIVYCLSVGAGKCLEKSLVVLRNNSVYSVSVPAPLSKESNARSKTTGSLGNAKKMERKVRTLRVHRKSSNRLGKDFPAINWYRRNATIRRTFCIPAKIFNFARHKERNWRNSCEKPLPKRQEEHFEDFDFFVFEQITKKIDLFGEWNFRWNVQWESSKASLFFIHPDSLIFFSQISMMFVSSTGNQNLFVSFWRPFVQMRGNPRWGSSWGWTKSTSRKACCCKGAAFESLCFFSTNFLTLS